MDNKTNYFRNILYFDDLSKTVKGINSNQRNAQGNVHKVFKK